MSFTFTNGDTGESLESKNSQDCVEILALLRKLTTSKSTLITMLPSGIGLDFEAQKNGQLWMEFYGDEPSAAFVSMAVAEEVVKRAFADRDRKIKEKYADLISKWEY